MAAARLGTSLDQGHRRLDPLPLPERVQGRKIVVSPKIEDDKGECTKMEQFSTARYKTNPN